MSYIYMYGMILATRSFLLYDDYPVADGYAEIKEYNFGVGGETSVASLILSSLGCNVVMAGANTGAENDAVLRNYFGDKSVDMGLVKFNKDFSGVIDNVIIDKHTRTCFGEFGRYFGSKSHWYEGPDEEAIAKCSVVGTDPFFGDDIIVLCKKHGKKYATIDSRYDSEMVAHCELIAISHQYLYDNYPGMSFDELYQLYTDHSEGLIIFTAGENPVMYGRKGQPPKFFSPYEVDVVSTLGAGDSFKAGTIYALNAGMNDDEIVEFACAVAGCACAKYPIAKNPPTLEKVKELIESRR